MMWAGPEAAFIRERYLHYLGLAVDGDDAAALAVEDGEMVALARFIEAQPVSNGGSGRDDVTVA